MLTGFLSLLSIRKQAYVGKPQTAMFFDEKKKRWVIEGEDESDDDEPPPPPPGARKSQIQVQESEIKQEQPQASQTGVNSLTTVAFAGALANKNRGKKNVGQGKNAPLIPKNQFGSVPQILNEENNKNQQNQNGEKNSLYLTANGELNQKSEQNNQENCNQEQSVRILESKEQDIQTSIILNQENEQNRNSDEREQLWLQKYNKQFEKIKDLREKVRRYEKELLIQRQENEQTIENFTQLCQDLKFRGMDEVDDLQAQIRGLQNQVEILASQKAEFQFQNEKYSYENEDFKCQNDLMNVKIDQLRKIQAQNESSITDQQEKQDLNNNDKTDFIQILDLQCENEKLKWQIQDLNYNSLRQNLQINQLKFELKQLSDQNQIQLRKIQSLNILLENENKSHNQKLEQMNKQFNDSQTILKLQIDKLNKEKEERKNQFIESQNQIGIFQEQIQQLHQVNLLLQQQIQQKNEKEKYYDSIKQQLVYYEQINKNMDEEGQIQMDSDFNEDFSKSSFSNDNESIEDKENSSKSDFQQLEENDYQKSSVQENKINQIVIDNKSNLMSKNEEQVMSPDKQSILAYQVQKQIDSKINQDQSANENQFNTTDNILRSQQIKEKIDFQIRNQFKKIQKQKILNRNLDPQILKEQLEEYKKQIKNDFEQRLAIEKKLHQKESFLSIQKEGIQDISNVIQSIMASENIMLLQKNKYEIKNAQASISFEKNQKIQGHNLRDKMGDQQSNIIEKEFDQQINPDKIKDSENLSSDSNDQAKIDHEIDMLIKKDQWDQTIEKIINKIFEVQKYYKSQISELQHKYQMIQMNSDQVDSLTLDIEIMVQEKQLLEQEINQFKQQMAQKNLQTKLMQQKLAEQMEKHTSEQAKMVVQEGEIERLKRLHQREQYKHEDIISSIKNSQNRQIKEIKDQYEQDIIPSVLAQQKEQMSQNQQQLSDKINSQKNILNDLTMKIQQLESQNETFKQEIRDLNLEKDKMCESAQINEIEKLELKNKARHLQEDTKQQVDIKNQIIEKMGEEMKQQKQIFYQQVSEITKQNDQRCSEIIKKRDQHKEQKKELMNKIDQQSSNIEDLTNELKKQKEQASQQEDKQFWQLIQQVNSLKQKNQIDQAQYHQEIQKINQIIENRQVELNEKDEEIIAVKMKQKEQEDQIASLRNEIQVQKQQIIQKENQINEEAKQIKNSEIFEKQLIDIKQILKVKQDENDEIKSLYEYQMSINDKLNFKISELKNKINEQDKQIIEERHSYEQKIQNIEQQLSDFRNIKIKEQDEKQEAQNEETTERISVMKWNDESNDSPIVQSIILSQETVESQANIDQIQIQKDENQNVIQQFNEIQDLKQQIFELENKNKLLIADCEKEKLEITQQLNNQISNLKELLKLQQEKQIEVPQEDIRNTESLLNEIEELKQKNQKFKNAAEEMAQKFKDKIKKEKEQNKKNQEVIKELQSNIQDNKNDFEFKLNDIIKCLNDLLNCLQNKSYVYLIKQFQEDNNRNQEFNSIFQSIISKINENQEQQQQDYQNIFFEIQKMMIALGIQNELYDRLIEKNINSSIQEIILELPNIFQQVIDQSQALIKKNQELAQSQEILLNQNDIIKNELEEYKQKIIESQKVIDELKQLNIDNQQQNTLKQENLKEEIKTEQKDEQDKQVNDELEKNKLYDEQIAASETRIKVSPSKNQPLKTGESSKVKNKVEPVQKAVAMQQKAGFFGQIVASLFLTESDSQVKENKSNDGKKDEEKYKKQDRQDTEYEEYYEYDEEDDGDAV